MSALRQGILVVMYAPSEWDLPELLDYVKHGGCQAGVVIAGITQYVPARPQKNLDTFWERLRLARLVFRGEADALLWPGQ